MWRAMIYIDTSMKGPKKKGGWYTYIVAVETTKGIADTGDTVKAEDATENQATLMALEAALKRLKSPCHLSLYLENDYVASALQNGWVDNWRYNGWMTTKNKPVADAEKWRSIQEILNEHDFEVCLKQPHTYREWMRGKLKEKEGK